MEKIPTNFRNDSLSEYLQKNGLRRISQGKVRDTYYLDEDWLLVVASDRISVFDFVLNASIPKKGEVLTALTHFWLTKVLLGFNNHLIEAGFRPYNFKGSKYPNAAYDLKGDLLDLPIERCLVVRNLTGKMYPFEMIYRHHIGGSVFKKYQKTGIAGGHQLPLGLLKWSKLDSPIFTPSTKEDVGHDVNVDANYFFAEMEKAGLTVEALEMVKMLTDAYAIAYKYAEERGILILDTKFEVAGGIIADEIITPDSSRFALKKDWEQALEEGRDPQFYDKQPVRDVMAKVATPFFDDKNQPITGINNLDPENEEHVAFVHTLEIPEEVITGTTERYLKIFEMITGQSLGDYQKNELGC
jgi:phosphoribosylaminoimidazole-succinocarboxamide synthase